MTIDRVTIEVQGGPGGNGVTTLYFLDGAAAQPAVVDFATQWRGGMPDECSLVIRNNGDTIDEETGDLVGSWSGGATTTLLGLQSGAWAAGVGMRVRWITAGFRRSRRVAGTSFLVPMSAAQFGTDGVPLPAWVDAVGDAASLLIDDTPGNMVVWSRQIGDDLGERHVVTSPFVPAEAAILRTRRT